MQKEWEPQWQEEIGWTVDFSIEGERIRRRLGIRDRGLKAVARKKAEQLYRQTWDRHLDSPALTAPPFYEAARGYVESGGEARFLPRLVEHFGADTAIDDIGEMEINEAAITIYPGRSPSTIRRQVLVPIQAVLRWARGERRQPGTDNPRTVWLTPEEAERLIQCAGPALDKIAFLLGSGCRSGEMFALDVKNWNSATRQAFIEDTKNGYPRWVRLPGRSVDLMGDLPDVGRMFKTPKGLAYKLRRHGGGQMQAAFNKARDAAGLGPEITPHVLRHTWATWYYAQTKDFGGLMDLGGWRKSDMANRYRKLAPDDLTARMLDFGWDFRQESGNLQRAGSLSLVSK